MALALGLKYISETFKKKKFTHKIFLMTTMDGASSYDRDDIQ